MEKQWRNAIQSQVKAIREQMNCERDVRPMKRIKIFDNGSDFQTAHRSAYRSACRGRNLTPQQD
jgi:hypothetical protein